LVENAQKQTNIANNVKMAQVTKIEENRMVQATDLAMVKKVNYGDDGLWDTGGLSLVQTQVTAKAKAAKGMTSFIKGLAKNDIASAKSQEALTAKKVKTKSAPLPKSLGFTQCTARLSNVVSASDQDVLFDHPSKLINKFTTEFCLSSEIAPHLQNLVRPNFCFYSGMILINNLQKDALLAGKKN